MDQKSATKHEARGPRKLEPKKRAFFLHTQVMRLQIEHPGIAVVAVKNIKQLLQPMAVIFHPKRGI